MKFTLFFIISCISNSLMGQRSYNWINFPTVDGIGVFQETRVREALYVEDNVKQIKCTSYYLEDDEKEVVNIMYSELGNVLSIRTTNYDPQSINGVTTLEFIQFEYDHQNKLVSERLLMVVEGDTIERMGKRSPRWFPHYPEPIARNAAGNITQISLAGDPTDTIGIALGVLRDTTYTFYDEFDRKIMDSIPSSNQDGIKIIYRYQGNKIHREFYFIDSPQAPTERYEYTVDERGNWIELKYFGLFDIENGFLTQLYTREIIYY